MPKIVAVLTQVSGTYPNNNSQNTRVVVFYAYKLTW